MLRIELGIWNRCDYFLHSTTLTYEEAKQRCDRVGRDLDDKMFMAPFHIPRTKQERNVKTNLNLKRNLRDGDLLRDLMIFIASGALPNLTTLNLGWNSIGYPGVSALADACASGAMGNLTWLHLNDNQIGDAGLAAFVDAIKPTPENPIGAAGELPLLDSNAIGEVGMQAFADAIRSGALGNLSILNIADILWIFKCSTSYSIHTQRTKTFGEHIAKLKRLRIHLGRHLTNVATPINTRVHKKKILQDRHFFFDEKYS